MTTQFEELLDLVGLKHETHQKEGVEWCLLRENAPEYKGGIIADEMGLGKTIEMLGVVHCRRVKSTLIVLPYSLLGQWAKIITQLFQQPPLIYHGGQRHRFTEECLKRSPIVITTYGLIAIKKVGTINPDGDGHLGKNPLLNITWDRIIYDEAHHLRNKKTAVNVGASQLKTGITWLLTGTPIQNSESDLHSLYTLLGFNSPEFIKENIKLLIRDYMLRRTKADAGIQLPVCHSTMIEVPWFYSKEEKLAENIHAKLTFSNIGTLREQLDNRTIVSDIDTVEGGHLKYLAKAKKVCVLPQLLYKGRSNMLGKASKIESVVDSICARKNNGKPKLVFCFFHGEIDELFSILKKHGMNVRKFDGRTRKKERVQILSEPCEVLIGQIDATNEGLNLQAYKEVYIVSPHWNPSVEDQAIARCHRIGQTEEVEVFHFVMTGFEGYEHLTEAPQALTLDQHICNVQEIKRDVVKKLLITSEEKEDERKQVIKCMDIKRKKRTLIFIE